MLPLTVTPLSGVEQGVEIPQGQGWKNVDVGNVTVRVEAETVLDDNRVLNEVQGDLKFF